MPVTNFQAILEDKIEYNDKFCHYFFELKEPHQLSFQAGQFLSLTVNEAGAKRAYSICSDPDIDHGVELLIDQTPNGVGVNFLKNLAFGDQVTFQAPLGRFVVEPNPAEKAIVLVGTGSGIAPLRSMALDLLKNRHDSRPITLFWGLRMMRDLIWQEEFSQLNNQYPNFVFHPVLSQPGPEWTLCRGHVTDCLQIHQLPAEAGYYLCGGQAMVTDVKNILAAKAVPATSIHHERFF